MRRRRWRTWVKHLLIALALVQLFRVLGASDPEAFRLAGVFYTLREIEQQLSKWRTNTAGQWLGAFGDAASAWIGAGLSWWIVP